MLQFQIPPVISIERLNNVLEIASSDAGGKNVL